MKARSDKANPSPQRDSLSSLGQVSPVAGDEVHPVLGMQRVVGNRTVQRLLSPSAEPASKVRPLSVTRPAVIQRDLKAYSKLQVDALPSAVDEGPSFLYTSAEAPDLRSALSSLISVGKVREVESKGGETSWFAAVHDQGTSLAEIETALRSAGYARAEELAKAIFDKHGEFLYANESLTMIDHLYSSTIDLGEKIENQTSRSLTEWEISEAKKVFGNAIDYSKVKVEDGSGAAWLGSMGGYARTVGNTIYFPDGSSRGMSLIIHELIHVWQYQTMGPFYAPKALSAQMGEGYNYTQEGKTAAESLVHARAEGRTLYDFNEEQQGDILRDYYDRLQGGRDVSAWQPFVNDVQNLPPLLDLWLR